MSIEGERFLQGLYQECNRCFQEDPQGVTVQRLLIDKVEQAAKQGILGDAAAHQITHSLEKLKERSITQLTMSEKAQILKAIVIASFPQKTPSIQGKDDEGYGLSGVSEGSEIKEQQQLFKEGVLKILKKGSFKDNAGNSIQVKADKQRGFILHVPLLDKGDLTDKELGKTDAGFSKMPQTFKDDQYDAQRGQYMRVSIGDFPDISMKNREDAEDLLTQVEAFEHLILSDKGGDHRGALANALLLFTTQHIENWLLSGLILAQKNLVMQVNPEDISTKVDAVHLEVKPVAGKKGKDQFQVQISAHVVTAHKQDPKTPLLEGSLQGSFICKIGKKEGVVIENLKVTNSLSIPK